MAKLGRVHFAGMGNVSARFNPLTLDFRSAAGLPAHTVLWLRNGGGKTTLLSLFYSVILPAKREWLGKFHQKPTQLSDYMFDREVGYIIIEFIFADGSRWLVGQVLVKRAADDVSRLCFTCRANGPVTLEALPVVGLGDTPAKTREAFFDYLKAENKRHPKAVELTELDLAKEGYSEWERHLVGIGIDPAVYRTHLVMNSDEGGLGEFFDFKTSDKFIEKLLEMADEPTALPDDAAGVDQAEAVVDKFRSKILGMPELEKEARFCQQLADGAKQYRVASEAVAAAAKRLLEVRVAAAMALFSVRTTLAKGDENLAEVNLLIKKATGEQQEAESIINTHSRYQQGYERTGIQLRHQEAEVGQRNARQGEAVARQDLALLLAADKLVDFEFWTTQVRTRKQALDDLLADRRPEIAAVENLGATLWQRLDAKVTAISTAIAELDKRITDNLAQARADKAKLVEAGERLKEFQRTIATINVNLKNYERERRALRESGLTKEGESAPDASARWQAEVQRIAQEIEQLRVDAGQLRASAKLQRIEASRQAEASSSESQAAETPRGQLRTASMEETDLRGQRLVQQHGGNAADLHNPGLLQAIQAQVDSYSAQVLSGAVGRAADERILSRHAPPNRPIFPVPVTTERVMELLRAKGVKSALPRYEWIAANCGLGEAERLLQDNPAIASGIMLQDPVELALVTPLVSAEGIDVPVSICIPANASTPAAVGHVIIPAERGYYNAAAAATSRELVQERVNTSKQQQDRLIAARKDAERICDRLQAYATTYSGARLRQLNEELDRHEANAVSHRAAARAAEVQAESSEERAAAMQEDVARLTSLRSDAHQKVMLVDKYIVDYHNRIDGWRAAEKQATDGAQEQERIQREITAHLEGLEDANEEHRGRLTIQQNERSQARMRRDAVPESYRRGVAQESALDLIDLEVEFRIKHEALEKELSESGLPEGIKVAEAGLSRAGDTYHSYVTSQRLRDADVKAAREMHADLPGALAAQQAASESAKQVLTLAEAEYRAATRARDDLHALLRDQRSTLHPEWPAPKTRAEAEGAAVRCREIEQRARESREAAATEIARLKERSMAVKDVAKALQPWVTELENRAGGHVASEGHPAFRPEPDTAPAFLDRIRKDVDAHMRGHVDAERRADELHRGKILAVLNDPQFANARMESRVRLLDLAQARTQFDHQLPDILANLASRMEVIAHSQAAIDAERDIVLAAMERRGSAAASLLRSAENLSEMPAEITAWAGHYFMKFTVNVKREEERRSFLRRLLEHWIGTNVAIPSGHLMAFECLLALMGSLDGSGRPQPKGAIKVEILKPEANLRYVYHDILAMRTFSGGELVTTAIILYCVMARLRAKRRGADVHLMRSDSGFLLLDNPVGKANLPDFLDLQIRIADIVGVQYICGTGINDIEALGAFPKVIRLRNSSMTRSGAYVVKLDKEQFNAVSGVAIAANTPILATAKKEAV